MTRWMRGLVMLTAAAAVGGLMDWGPATGFTSIAEAKPKGPKGPKGPKEGPKKGKDHLVKAYEALTDIAAWTEGGRARPPRDLAPLLDQAKDLYRDAVRAARDEEPRRADELAAAAHDAARGLVHALRANSPATRGLPAPPRGDEDELDELLRRTRDRLDDVGDQGPRGAGRTFLEAARRFSERARQAGRDDDVRAIQLARAAEAWTHVGEHLMRADPDVGFRPDPERRRERPLPPADRHRPPPPPPRD